MIRILEAEAIGDLLKRRHAQLMEAEQTVAPILEDVARRGDAAVHEYARKLDRFEGKRFQATAEELAKAADRLSPELRSAIEVASANIRAFAEMQMPREEMREIMPGVITGQLIRPLETIAAYIPSGRYPLPSTLMMTTIPAQVAGVQEICATSPRVVDAIDGTAHMLGIDSVFRLGGAHAIAAFAFGTATVPRADRIVGPGNIYVAAAKRLLAGQTGIDFVAGPTEILIVADTGDPAHIAADMLAQAEHDPASSALLFTTSRDFAQKVARAIDQQLATLPTADVARKAIDRNSAVVLVDSLEEAIDHANDFAPEHLSVHDESLIPLIQNAGSVFVGAMSPEAAGDYASGPNHVLPTSGHAALRGGLSVMDFVKVISYQKLTKEGLRSLAPTVTTLARAEGLEAHARSVEVRL